MGSAAPSLSPILRAGSSTPLPARSLCSSARRNPRCLCSGSCPLRRRLRWQRRRRRRSSAAGSHGTDTNCRFQCNSTSPAIYIFDEMRDPKVCLPSGRPLPLLFDFLAAATSSPPLHHNVISSFKTVKVWFYRL